MEHLEDIIHDAIEDNMQCIYLEVSGDSKHFEAIVVSDEFDGRSLVERHRKVYACLGNKMGSQIHALSMKLYTQEEWKQLNG